MGSESASLRGDWGEWKCCNICVCAGSAAALFWPIPISSQHSRTMHTQDTGHRTQCHRVGRSFCWWLARGPGHNIKKPLWRQYGRIEGEMRIRIHTLNSNLYCTQQLVVEDGISRNSRTRGRGGICMSHNDTIYMARARVGP